MHTIIKAVRLCAALIAIWQFFGLLPLLAWLPNLPPLNHGAWVTVLIKVVVLLICVATYYGLRAVGERYNGKKRGPSDSKIIALSVLSILAVGVAATIILPMLHERDDSTVSASSTQQHSPVTPRGSSASNQSQPQAGWTQESTGSSESGPWLMYDQPGTRYLRADDGIIYRFYPPGMRPDAEAANPLALQYSRAHPPRD